jgi:transposase
VTWSDGASPVAGPRGFGSAKKVDGVKRHVLVDSAGILVAAVVTPATTLDRAAFPPRRWVVECTNGWINHCRRLDRHY